MARYKAYVEAEITIEHVYVDADSVEEAAAIAVQQANEWIKPNWSVVHITKVSDAD